MKEINNNKEPNIDTDLSNDNNSINLSLKKWR